VVGVNRGQALRRCLEGTCELRVFVRLDSRLVRNPAEFPIQVGGVQGSASLPELRPGAFGRPRLVTPPRSQRFAELRRLMAHIFISYARSDVWAMRAVRYFLISAGFRTWADETGLQPGTADWRAALWLHLMTQAVF
jgi:hypothetical protein